MENSKLKIQFDCTKEIQWLYECRCGNFKTDFFVHLWQHLQENHRAVNELPLQIHKCSCSLKTYSKYLILRHQFFDKCLALESEPQVVPVMQEVHKKQDSVTYEHYNFMTKRSQCLNRHVLEEHVVITESQWHQCKRCPKRYKRRHDLINHLINHPEEREWYLCKQCPKKFKVRRGLKNHLREVHCVQQLKCQHCSYESKRERDLISHVLLKHVHLPETEWHHCDQCPKKYKVKHILASHVAREHSKRRFKCEQCSFQTKRRHCLTKHIVRKHVKVPETEWHQCQHCPKRFKVKTDLKTHVRRVHSTEVFKCEQCNFQARNQLYLTNHIARKHIKVTESEWHQCRQCSKRFKVKYDLSSHVRRVHSSVVFKCEQCSFQAKRKFWLTEHYTREHAQLSEIEWHQCEQCSIRFKVKRDLRKHAKLTHSNDVFECK